MSEDSRTSRTSDATQLVRPSREVRSANQHSRKKAAGTSTIQIRVPANLDAERTVLGAIIMHGGSFDSAQGLRADDFSLQAHRKIWRALTALHTAGSHIDIVTTAEELRRQGELEHAGGVGYIVGFDEGLPYLYNIKAYADILREKTILRRAQFAAEALLNGCSLFDAKASDIIAQAQSLLAELGRETLDGEIAIEDLPDPEACGSENVVYVHRPEVIEGTVTALTGDPGCGKSTLMLAYCRRALAEGRAALILDCENPLSTVLDRMRRLKVSGGPLLRWNGGWNGRVRGPEANDVLVWIKKTTPRPIVVVDSMSGFHGGDQNDAGQTRAFMDYCRRLADQGAPVVLLHHSGKAETAKEYRGSSDFLASVDQAFHVTNFNPDGGNHLHTLTVRCFKSRFGFSGALVYRYDDGRLERDDAPTAEIQTVSAQLIALLRLHPGISGKQFEQLASDRKLGRNRARQFLSRGSVSGIVSRETYGRKVRYSIALDDSKTTDEL